MKLFSKLGLTSLLAVVLLCTSCYQAPTVDTTNYIVPGPLPEYFTTYCAGDSYQISFPEDWTVLSSTEVTNLDREIEETLDPETFLEEKLIFFAGLHGELYGREYYDPAVVVTTGPKPAFYTLDDIAESVKLGIDTVFQSSQVVSTKGGQLHEQGVVILEIRGKYELGGPYYQLQCLVTIADKTFYTATCRAEATEPPNPNALQRTVVESFQLY